MQCMVHGSIYVFLEFATCVLGALAHGLHATGPSFPVMDCGAANCFFLRWVAGMASSVLKLKQCFCGCLGLCVHALSIMLRILQPAPWLKRLLRFQLL